MTTWTYTPSKVTLKFDGQPAFTLKAYAMQKPRRVAKREKLTAQGWMPIGTLHERLNRMRSVDELRLECERLRVPIRLARTGFSNRHRSDVWIRTWWFHMRLTFAALQPHDIMRIKADRELQNAICTIGSLAVGDDKRDERREALCGLLGIRGTRGNRLSSPIVDE